MNTHVGAAAALMLAAAAVPSFAATTAKPNIATVYTFESGGGTGSVAFPLSLKRGLYQISFTANFEPAGSPSAPETFGCSLTDETTFTLYAQDTTLSTGLGSTGTAFLAGVNGVATVRVTASNAKHIGMHCGTSDGSKWSWGTAPLAVSVLSIDRIRPVTVSAAYAIQSRHQRRLDVAPIAR